MMMNPNIQNKTEIKAVIKKDKTQKKEIKKKSKVLAKAAINAIPNEDAIRAKNLFKQINSLKMNKKFAKFSCVFNEYSIILLDEIKKNLTNIIVKKDKEASKNYYEIYKELSEFVDVRSKILPEMADEIALSTSVESILNYFARLEKQLPIMVETYKAKKEEYLSTKLDSVGLQAQRLFNKIKNHKELMFKIKGVVETRIIVEYQQEYLGIEAKVDVLDNFDNLEIEAIGTLIDDKINDSHVSNGNASFGFLDNDDEILGVNTSSKEVKEKENNEEQKIAETISKLNNIDTDA